MIQEMAYASLPPRPILFLDDGGVMTEKAQRARAIGHLVGTYFVSRFGGAEEDWSMVHRVITAHLADPQAALVAPDFLSFYQLYQLQWVGGMCELLGLPPPSEEECLALAHDALTWMTRRMRASLPGAVEAIRLLHQQGYTLYTASGSCSLELEGALEGMGVRQCFARLYRADLVNAFKDGTEYYTRIFADVGILPSQALVIDDTLQALRWARQVGTHTVLVGAASRAEQGEIPCIRSLADLPAFLQRQSKEHRP